MPKKPNRGEVESELRRLRFNVVEHLVAIVLHPNTNQDTKHACLKTLATYRYPKPEIQLSLQHEGLPEATRAELDKIRRDPVLSRLYEEISIRDAEIVQQRLRLEAAPPAPSLPFTRELYRLPARLPRPTVVNVAPVDDGTHS